MQFFAVILCAVVASADLTSVCPWDGSGAMPTTSMDDPKIYPGFVEIDAEGSHAICSVGPYNTAAECEEQCHLVRTCRSFIWCEPGYFRTTDQLPRDTCQMFGAPLGFDAPGDNYGEFGPADGACEYYEVHGRDTTPELPVITFTAIDRNGVEYEDGDIIPDVHYTEGVTIKGSLVPYTDKDINILFSFTDGNIRRGQDYWTSFPATNLVKIAAGSTTGSWVINNKIAKAGVDKTFHLKVVFITNAGTVFTGTEPTFTIVFEGGRR